MGLWIRPSSPFLALVELMVFLAEPLAAAIIVAFVRMQAAVFGLSFPALGVEVCEKRF